MISSSDTKKGGFMRCLWPNKADYWLEIGIFGGFSDAKEKSRGGYFITRRLAARW